MSRNFWNPESIGEKSYIIAGNNLVAIAVINRKNYYSI